MRIQTLTSTANPRVKAAASLARSGRDRRQAGCFLVDSARDLLRALLEGFEVLELFVENGAGGIEADIRTILSRLGSPASERELDDAENQIKASSPDIYRASPQILERIAYRQNPQPMLAVLRARPAGWDDLPTSPAPLMAVCSELEKPGNFGAILRSADGAGLSGLIVDREDFDLYNPNAIRASTGAIFGLPILPASPDAGLKWLRDHGVALVAASPDGAVDYDRADYRRPTAFILGAEDRGLSDFWRQAADQTVRIPTRGRVVDSLNVSVAAALLFFEAARQRRQGG